MSTQWRVFAAMLVITIVAAGFAGWAGVEYGMRQASATGDLDATLHRDLDLTPDQDRRLDTLEARFAADRARLQAEMRQANADLARSIVTTHSYGPDTQRAIERFHRAMGTLQEDTVRHILAMRAVLTPGQQQRFDQTIAKALGADAP